MTMNDLLLQRKRELRKAISTLATEKMMKIKAIKDCNDFLSAATWDVRDPKNMTALELRTAAQGIPVEFETLDVVSTAQGIDRRVQPFIRSQLFIALVSEVEDFFTTILERLFEAYPENIFKIYSNFETMSASNSPEDIVSACVKWRCKEFPPLGTLGYWNEIEKIVGMPPPNVNNLAQQYIEIKARRNAGVHTNWRRDQKYDARLAEAQLTAETKTFLGVDSKYFALSVMCCINMISECNKHCEEFFAPPSSQA